MHCIPPILNVCLWHGVSGEGYTDWSIIVLSTKLILFDAIALVGIKDARHVSKHGLCMGHCYTSLVSVVAYDTRCARRTIVVFSHQPGTGVVPCV